MGFKTLKISRKSAFGAEIFVGVVTVLRLPLQLTFFDALAYFLTWWLIAFLILCILDIIFDMVAVVRE